MKILSLLTDSHHLYHLVLNAKAHFSLPQPHPVTVKPRLVGWWLGDPGALPLFGGQTIHFPGAGFPFHLCSAKYCPWVVLWRQPQLSCLGSGTILRLSFAIFRHWGGMQEMSSSSINCHMDSLHFAKITAGYTQTQCWFGWGNCRCCSMKTNCKIGALSFSLSPAFQTDFSLFTGHLSGFTLWKRRSGWMGTKENKSWPKPLTQS